MEDENRTVAWVLATIILVVASGYAGFASLENHLMAGKGTAEGAYPVVIQAVARRSVILLVVAILFGLIASVVFGQALPERPGRTSVIRYAISTALTGVAIAIVVIVLHVTATLLKMV